MRQVLLVSFSFIGVDVLTWVPAFFLKQNHASILNAPPEQITLAIILGCALNLFTYYCLYMWVKKNTTFLAHVSTFGGIAFGIGIAFAWFSIITFSPWLLFAAYFIKLVAYGLQLYHLDHIFS